MRDVLQSGQHVQDGQELERCDTLFTTKRYEPLYQFHTRLRSCRFFFATVTAKRRTREGVSSLKDRVELCT